MAVIFTMASDGIWKGGYKQEMAPKGGFPAIRTRRVLPRRGPSGAMLFSLAAGVIGYGFYKVGKGNDARRKLKEEKREARVAILPFLQAEDDARYNKAKAAFLAEEAEVMKDVPGWEVGKKVYNTDRWVAPTQNNL